MYARYSIKVEMLKVSALKGCRFCKFAKMESTFCVGADVILDLKAMFS